MTTIKPRCCDITNVCGYTLRQGTKFVGFTSLVVSVISLFSSVVFIALMANSDKSFNNSPVRAIDMIFALCCTSTSLYQVAISLMLLWFTLWDKGTPFLLSLWYVSHLAIMTIYSFILTASAIIYFHASYYIKALFVIAAGFAYNAIFIYFCIIVNSFMNSIPPDIAY